MKASASTIESIIKAAISAEVKVNSNESPDIKYAFGQFNLKYITFISAQIEKITDIYDDWLS